MLDGTGVIPLFHLPHGWMLRSRVQQLAALRGNLAGSRGRSVTFRTKLLFISSFTVAGAVALVTGAVSDFDAARIRADRQRAARSSARPISRGAGRAERGHRSARGCARDIARRAADRRGHRRVRSCADRGGSRVARFSGCGPARFDHHFVGALAGALRIQERLADRTGGLALDRRFSGAHSDAGRERGGADRGAARRRRTRHYVAGGRRLTPELLKSLGIAPGMRALLWVPPGEVIDAQGTLQRSAQARMR